MDDLYRSPANKNHDTLSHFLVQVMILTFSGIRKCKRLRVPGGRRISK